MQLTVKGKGGKVRTVPISNGVRAVLEPLLSQTGRGHKLFLPEDSHTDTEIERIQQFVIRHRDEFQSGERTYPLHIHGLRHTFAQERYLSLVASGLTELEATLTVSKLLGHNRPEVTNIYLAGMKDGDGDV